MASESKASTSRPDLSAAGLLDAGASAALSVGGSFRSKDPSASVGTSVSAPKWLGKRVGRFRLIGLIGRGAMGKVFRAEDIQLHRLAALKVIGSRSSSKKTAAEKLEMLLREARSAAKLEHPNIVTVYEVNSAFDVHFIAMELVEGGNLKDLVQAAGPLDVARACQLVADAADALQHAHEQGVIHRDVKPANLMLTRNGRCKLGDFGLARIGDAGDALDQSSGPVGTPQFVAPEVVQGYPATPQSDIYSLGGTLFYLLTGSPPFPGENSRECIRRHIEELPPDVRTIRPEVPESLALTIWRSMSKEPAARFESAAHFARAVRQHTIQVESAAAEGDVATAPAEPRDVLGWVAASPMRIAFTALAFVALLVGLVAAIVVMGSRVSKPGPGNAFNPSARPSPAATKPSDASEDVGGLPLPARGAVIVATNTPVLLRIAQESDPTRHDGRAAVEGWIRRIEFLRAENLYRIDLRGVDRKRGLACTFSPDLLPELTMKFGSDPEITLAGKKVQIRGAVDLSDGQPLIELRSAAQISIIE
jgi:tRNA A-37 threonylcarbamoyl transferase component Bud32